MRRYNSIKVVVCRDVFYVDLYQTFGRFLFSRPFPALNEVAFTDETGHLLANQPFRVLDRYKEQAIVLALRDQIPERLLVISSLTDPPSLAKVIHPRGVIPLFLDELHHDFPSGAV